MNLPVRSAHSLYDPRFEHDACGIGFVARINGAASHEILVMALEALGNLEHRGAVADDAKTGDGAGILTQLPRALLMRELAAQGLHAEADALALGMFFLPVDAEACAAACAIIDQALNERGIERLAWREVPVDADALGERARAAMPQIRQAILLRPATSDPVAFERMLFLARKAMERAFMQQGLAAYIPSLSCRTVVYKGLLLGTNLAQFYHDLRDPEYTSALAVYHQRYSTNTFPTWERAQPFRMLSHNGEINTIQGNANWMRAREAVLHLPEGFIETPVDGPKALYPALDMNGSDSAMLDNALELLVLAGRDVRHAMTMMVPEAWEKIRDLTPALRAFYQYHACLIEPWDGPAALTFSDGRIVGTALDRNGLRPARYIVTDDGLVVSGSEVGAVQLDEARVVHKGKLGPGQMIAVDTESGRFFTNDEVKEYLAGLQPYMQWVGKHLQGLELPPSSGAANGKHEGSLPPDEVAELTIQQVAFGYSTEDLNVVMKPMGSTGQEPVGSMGDDTPAAVLSRLEVGRPLFHYFKQRFAEVTNPPIDSLREDLVMSLSVALGRRRNLLEATPEHAHLIQLTTPILTDDQLAALRATVDPELVSATVPALCPVGTSLANAVAQLRAAAEKSVRAGASILIISDRGVTAEQAPIPILLAVSAVHHHLIRTGLRTLCSIVAETGELREVHHLACLTGYGAEAVNPYLALASISHLVLEREALRQKSANGTAEVDNTRNAALVQEALEHFIHALEKGLLKVMSKMGISALDSYCGAQIFEVFGLEQALVDECFSDTPTRVGGVGFGRIERDMRARHARAFDLPAPSLGHPGIYKYKKDGEYHAFGPPIIHALHKAVRNPHALTGDSQGPGVSDEGYAIYRAYADLVNQRPPVDPRDLLELVPAGPPVPLDEVEPIEAIVPRFSTAAMSHGSTSSEAHETLSIAMNRLGGLANSGEGGEDYARYQDERISRIKQVASGRFGVTPTYLANAVELQIKMAQGAKPGEGGQLPGHKVNEEIARIRHTVPGVALISPPPHHDIYSIEDLAQLIYDLKQVNQGARVSVKLVATAGVGTIAAGVAKGYADTILISGHSGGTGAAALSSIKNVGLPWELGLAETQQTLVLNGLRDRVRLRADGGLKTGRDVLMAALLGADEYSFGTAALVAEGCIMARACHNNTCPVGIATQRQELRAKFTGKPEMVIAFFRYMAQEIRELLASLGLRSMDEAVGRSDLLRQRSIGVGDADTLDLTPVIGSAHHAGGVPLRHGGQMNALPPLETINDRIMHDTRGALAGRGPVTLSYEIRNRDRSAGTRLAGVIGQLYGHKGLPEGTITIKLRGSAGQSFGTFNAPGMSLLLTGEANDYVGKGMAGGLIVVAPDPKARFAPHENVIAGNTLLYGATGGELYAAGQVGERFAVRNSGATAVVEGVGDHGCEYMTGGVAVILGQTGRNFGAGMTGGVAFVLDEAGTLAQRHNPQLIELQELSSRDEARVQALIKRHIELTGSARGSEILARWEVYRPLFRAVYPRAAVARIENAVEGAEELHKPARAA
ncbi:glutamate synthase large subunit [Candidatus Viridilinea mediisalina]|uniref:Glutamate synthase large subunit n=1 Tax=Candidatus Viridilinea mediisalina TaxID=2024553 RepID=A0A2A6RJ10_9CHLR|nr:glutamate synthase large subunit [Candidatus Viridilinea mediisalina]PDW02879.1 glutamate synthase large subunit [Candidatus Viridilinea mediisalina]